MNWIMDHIIAFLAICLVILNLFGFIQFGVDKAKAKKGQWRIPEHSLFLTALCGGSVGCILGMQVFHHKTKHNSFKYGMPAILLLQIAAIIAVIVLV